MKTRFVALSFLLISGLAVAGGPMKPVAEPDEAPLQKQMTNQERARMHQRDLRYCLDKKSNKEIHRCTVRQRKR